MAMRQKQSQAMTAVETPQITVIVPVKDEQASIDHFVAEFSARVAADIADFTILFIDDGSTDNTIEVIEAARRRDPRVHYLKLARNFGKEAAMTAGLDHADGDAAIIMDVDLQDPPEVIPQFIQRWRQGYDTVYGVRVSRDEDTHAKRFSARLFYRLFNMASGISIPDNVGDFRLVSRRMIDALRQLPERNRFMKGLFAWPGYSAIGVPYERPARARGHTSFNGWKLWNFALDGITSFSSLPLRIWTYCGIFISFGAFLYMLKIIVATLLFGNEVPGYSSMMCVLLFLGGIQLISIGIIGEYVGRLYIETKARPIYLLEADSRRDSPVDP
jgi:glycosyltransferase involved in cell wall biosynthesis